MGFVLGPQKAVITIALGRGSYGFMGKLQALGGVRLSDPATMAKKLFELLKSRLIGEQHLLDAAIDAFAASTHAAWIGFCAPPRNPTRTTALLTPNAAYQDSLSNGRGKTGVSTAKKSHL